MEKTSSDMNKKIWIPVALAALLLIGGIAYLGWNLNEKRQELNEMQELAELDKQEMENEYQDFALQYSEMMTKITNDSLIQQLTIEQEKNIKLLEELKTVKANDAREITRLKKELATCRSIIRSYVLEIDSLNRLNQSLAAENDRIKAQNEEASRQIETLNTDKEALNEKVAIAAQLDATGLNLTLLDKRNKRAKKLSKCKTIQASFTVSKNVTASNGTKTFYVRITSPTGSTLGNAGNFAYENRQLQCSMKKTVEYSGQELPMTLFWEVSQTLQAGTYQMSVFADGNMIGSRSFTFE